MKKLVILAPLLALLYAGIFLHQERLFAEQRQVLSFVPAAPFLWVCSGYWRQLTAEAIFIKTAVFLGGVIPGSDREAYASAYAPALANNYRQITLLYPEFRDPYYFAQGYLPSINQEAAKATNDILATGLASYPDSYDLRLFMAFNYLNNLDQPLQAAEVFHDASLRPNSPPVFAYLAALFSADGGDLQAALIMLRALNEAENEQRVKGRYAHEIVLLEKAIGLFHAAKRYQAAHGAFPDMPEQLVPNYIAGIPDFMPYFELLWQPPRLRLKRPDPAKLRRYQQQQGKNDHIPF